jgi:mono/diheme cytochrome c family protein
MKKAILGFVVLFIVSTPIYAQMGDGMMNDQGQMTGQEKQQSLETESTGAKIFNADCAVCHPNGGNVIMPNLPLIGSSKLENLEKFLSFIRSPKMPDGSQGSMPSFPTSKISDNQAKELYHFLKSAKEYGAGGGYGTMGGYGMGPGMMGGYGMGPGMMGGYGMGPGMMGGYGMGPGMMGGYGMGPGMMGDYGMGSGTYSRRPECLKFYDDTAKLRKELNDKRFEYFETVRNPKSTMEMADNLQKQILELQQKIYSKAPRGCWW